MVALKEAPTHRIVRELGHLRSRADFPLKTDKRPERRQMTCRLWFAVQRLLGLY
jgi:hypothetical protein